MVLLLLENLFELLKRTRRMVAAEVDLRDHKPQVLLHRLVRSNLLLHDDLSNHNKLHHLLRCHQQPIHLHMATLLTVLTLLRTVILLLHLQSSLMATVTTLAMLPRTLLLQQPTTRILQALAMRCAVQLQLLRCLVVQLLRHLTTPIRPTSNMHQHHIGECRVHLQISSLQTRQPTIHLLTHQ